MWPLGVALTSWVYLWRTTPVHRREVEGSLDSDLPPRQPELAPTEDVQRPEDGAGPLFHRTYTRDDPRVAVERRRAHGGLKADPNLVAPLALARFRKSTSVAEKVVPRTGGRLQGGIDIETRRVDAGALASALQG